MVERQLRRRGIADERVLAAMAAVPRERFVAERLERRAYADSALPIGDGQTISQPWVVAAICQALALAGDERVLEIGTGSGYSAAVLALLAGEVLSIERFARARRPRRASALDGARHRERRGPRRRRHAGAPGSRRRSTRSPSTPPRRRRRRACSRSSRRAAGW